MRESITGQIAVIFNHNPPEPGQYAFLLCVWEQNILRVSLNYFPGFRKLLVSKIYDNYVNNILLLYKFSAI